MADTASPGTAQQTRPTQLDKTPGHGIREQQTRPTQLDKTLFGRSPAVQEAGPRRQAGSTRWFEEVFLAAWQSEMSPLDCQDACR